MSISTPILDSTKLTRSADSGVRRAAIIAGIVLLAHAPLIFAHFQLLWLKPHYQLFPMVLAGGFALIWPFKKVELNPTGPIRYAIYLMAAGIFLVVVGMVGESMNILPGSPASWIATGGILQFASIPLGIAAGLGAVNSSRANPQRGLSIVAISCFMLAIGVFFASGTMCMFSALTVIVGTTMTLGGRSLFLRCLPALCYLLLVIPPPFGLDTTLVLKLQKLASTLSSRILDLMGVMHNLNGVTIEVGAAKFEVENACSGISSLLSTLACVGFYVLWYRIHWLRSILLVLASVFWVLVNNTARIVCITYFDVNWGINMARGLPHQILGMILFGLTLFLIWSTDRLLMFFGRSDLPVRRFEPLNVNSAALESGFEAGMTQSGAWYRSAALAGLFGLILAAQAVEWWAFASQVPYSGSGLSKLYSNIDVNLLPESVGRWIRPKEIEFEERAATNPLGQYSRIWRYTNQVLRAECAVSLDYPYPEYHDLRICYQNSGWKTGTPKVFQRDLPSGQKMYCMYVPMERPVEKHASLWFCNFDQDGTGLVPSVEDTQVTTLGQRMVDRFIYAGNRWQRLLFPSKTAANTGLGSILQVQLITQSFRPIHESVQADLEKLFVQAAELLQAKCVELKNRPGG